MGYFTKPIIADDTVQPAIISLSGVSNFLELTARRDSANVPTNLTLEVSKIDYSSEEGIETTQFTVTELSDRGLKIVFKGTTDAEKVDDKTFLMNDDAAVVAENICGCILKQSFFKTKFNVSIPFTISDDNTVVNGSRIVINSIDAGAPYRFSLESNNSFLRIVNGDPEKGHNGDMIDRGMGNCDIEADIYSDTGVFLGEDDKPQGAIMPGKLLATMSKSYFGQPIWFDVNSLMSTSRIYSNQFLESCETEIVNNVERYTQVWADAGTATDFRLVLRTFNGSKREAFYYSNVLYAVTGYARSLDKVDLQPYVYTYNAKRDNTIKLLTNQPSLPHTQGQSQYLNFIFSDAHRSGNGGANYNLGIYYNMYTHSGKFLDSRIPLTHQQSRTRFATVNTVKLDMDKLIDEVENAKGEKVGIVRAYLCRNRSIVSHPLQFDIMPHCLHRVHDFAFLNSLGGWSSFNFGGDRTLTVKSEANTLYRAQLPHYTASSEIEAVFDKEIKESYTIKTQPISASVADWLRELTASVAVYELSTKRYIVIDDFDIKHNTADNLFTLEMKYHYSDTYNATIK